MPDPILVFVCYAHEDEAYRARLQKSLRLMERKGLVATWHDRKILPGSEWEEEIDEALEKARLILLLISADFFASDYCWGREMARALERHGAGEARVIPIVVRACPWEDSPIAGLQVLPTGGKPVASWPLEDEAWLDVSTGLRRAIDAPGALPGELPGHREVEQEALRARSDARSEVPPGSWPVHVPVGIDFVERGIGFNGVSVSQEFDTELEEVSLASAQFMVLVTNGDSAPVPFQYAYLRIDDFEPLREITTKNESMIRDGAHDPPARTIGPGKTGLFVIKHEALLPAGIRLTDSKLVRLHLQTPRYPKCFEDVPRRFWDT